MSVEARVSGYAHGRQRFRTIVKAGWDEVERINRSRIRGSKVGCKAVREGARQTGRI